MGPVSQTRLETVIKCSITHDPGLASELCTNKRIVYRNGSYMYRCLYPAQNKEELLEQFKKNQNGILRRDICENYAGANEDISRLCFEGKVYIIKEIKTVSGTDSIFYRDDMGIEIDDDIISLWREATPSSLYKNT